MKRAMALVLVLGVVLLSGLFTAHAFPEQDECTVETTGLYTTDTNGRGAVCGAGAVYVGGNATTPCGEIWVAGGQVIDSDGTQNNANDCA